MSAWPKIARSAFCCLAFALGPLTAHAQTAEDKAAAEALFDEGRTLMEKGDVAGACRKFEESDRLDTAPGTLLNLAGCYERLGKVASAWATYRRAAPLARERGQTEREKFARTRATELEPRLPRLRILVPDQSKVEGLTIARDGKDLAASLWGQSLPVDPGTVQVTVSARGRESWSGRAELSEGKTEELVVPLLKPLPPAAEPAAKPVVPAAPTAAPGQKPVDQTAAPPDPHRGRTQRVASYVVGGLAVVALGATGFLALQARSKNEDSAPYCGLGGDPNRCDRSGVSLREDALRYGNWATVTGVAAGVLAAGAVTLYFTAPKAQVGLLGGFDHQGATVALKGHW
jgi:serine/threonine-protein kinase